VGILFIIGTAAGVLSVVFTGPILDGPDYLVKIPANENQIIIGAFLILIMGFALVMVPVMLYPILKKQNEVLALGAVVFRGVLEGVGYIISANNLLFLIIKSGICKSRRSGGFLFSNFGRYITRSRYLYYE
jgi:hypothetical protein